MDILARPEWHHLRLRPRGPVVPAREARMISKRERDGCSLLKESMCSRVRFFAFTYTRLLPVGG